MTKATATTAIKKEEEKKRTHYTLYVCFNRTSDAERESGNKARKKVARRILSNLLNCDKSKFKSGAKEDGFDTVLERNLSGPEISTLVENWPYDNADCGPESAAILRRLGVPTRLFAWLEDPECTEMFDFHKTHTSNSSGHAKYPKCPYLCSKGIDSHFIIGPIDLGLALSFWYECDNEARENGLWDMMHTLMIAVTGGVNPRVAYDVHDVHEEEHEEE